ncbi:MAG TPA: hypothetical protein VHM01_05385 [Alphaproteobacteria bacterium]|nr:hypothetical protein [Alphaproteobacteria bacterium]
MRRHWVAIWAVLAVVLAGCQTTPPAARFPDLTYGHLGIMRFDVERVEIASEYQPPLRAPNVDHLFPTPPERVMRRWAQDRLAANGTPGRFVRFVILDAKVIETNLPRTTGLTGAFTKDQSQRYDLTLSAAIEVREDRGNFRTGYATASTSRSRTVREDITVNDREKVWFEMLEQAMNELNAELDRQVKANMTRFLVM